MAKSFQPELFEHVFHPLNAWLEQRFEEVTAREFYRELFPAGALARAGELVAGKYRGVAIRIKEGQARRFSINDGLEILDQTEQANSDEFWLASPVSYAGRTQRQEMSRHLYAVVIDLDGIRIENPVKPRGLGAMWNQITHGHQPCPTFIVSSGTGLHMYYFLETPIAMYRPMINQLRKFRHDLITRVWSSFVTELWERPQYESVTQGFRMVGTPTKNGQRVRAFRVGRVLDITELNDWVKEPNQITQPVYKSELTLDEAREKYPDWYQNRIVEGRPRGTWKPKRALYEWWRDQKINEAKTGHRYFYLMALAIYAMKCGISEEELHNDAWNLVKALRDQDLPDNPLTDDDVNKALAMYNDVNYQTFPRATIANLTGITIPPNKRNYQKQCDHLEETRAIRDIRQRRSGTNWWDNGNRQGAPTKEGVVRAWREANPGGRKIACERETGLSRHTVLKWWNA